MQSPVLCGEKETGSRPGVSSPRGVASSPGVTSPPLQAAPSLKQEESGTDLGQTQILLSPETEEYKTLVRSILTHFMLVKHPTKVTVLYLIERFQCIC